MPELPEVETVKRFLDKNIVREKTHNIKILNRKLRYEIPLNLSKQFYGSTITKIVRRGKYLIIYHDNSKIILFHLGMTGFFRISKSYEKRKHDHVSFFFKDKILTFNDIRKFGFLKVFSKEQYSQCLHLKNLGPEPLSQEFNSEYFKKAISRKISIKSLLMNQEFVAGLGNIYVSEILHDAKVDPRKLVASLSKLRINSIIKSTKSILKQAINFGGTTIKNFMVSDKKIGYFRLKLKVYGRENLKCFQCSQSENSIIKIIQGGRSTFFCRKCQR